MARELMPNEHVVRVTRAHWSVFVAPVLVTVLIAALVGALLALTPGTVGGHGIGEVKLFVGLGAGVLLAGAMLIRLVQWRCTFYMLTDHRIVVARGVLSRFTESISLDRVQDASVRQGLFGRIFRAGDVEIESAGKDGAEVLHRIYDPERFSQALLTAIDVRHGGQPYPGVAPGYPPQAGPPPSQPGYYPPQGGYAPPQPGAGPPPAGGYGPPPGYAPRRGGGDGL